MYSLKIFLEEASSPQKGAVKHLTHPEDLHLQYGENGLHHAISSLEKAHSIIKHKKDTAQLTTKWDGSPAIIYGHHHQTGRFFVATKSLHNASPKINYTHADIEKNHGHAPNLASKLHSALTHLPRIVPQKGVYQGDLMFTHGDVKSRPGGKASFNPNPSGLTYTAHGEAAKKIKKAHIGLVTHIKYSMPSMHPTPIANHEGEFKHSEDVYHINPTYRHGPSLDKENEKHFNHHILAARHINSTYSKNKYHNIEPHMGPGNHLETYINHTVKNNVKPTTQGFEQHMIEKHQQHMGGLKTDIGKQRSSQTLHKHLQHIAAHKQDYETVFRIHHHIQQAKNALVNHLNKHQEFEHHHRGQPTNPEGYVVYHNGIPSKLIHRHEFSRLNLTSRDLRKSLKEEIIQPKTSLMFSRQHLPQVHASKIEHFTKWLNNNNIQTTFGRTHPSKLKATQGELNTDKIKEIMKNQEALNKPIITSSDNYILDGIHRWAALKELDQHANIIQANLPITGLIAITKKYPHVGYKNINE